MLVLDHLTVSAATLSEGVAWVEAALGVSMAGGGQHAQMGTHNRLLSVGDVYVEVIAIDPSAKDPEVQRWFDLNRFNGHARLTNWVARCDDLAAEVACSPAGVGVPVALQRGDYRWLMAVPADGRLPFGGAFPALIEWQGKLHPARTLPDAGVRLEALEISHPEADVLRVALNGRLADRRLVISQGPLALRARFATPYGERHLA